MRAEIHRLLMFVGVIGVPLVALFGVVFVVILIAEAFKSLRRPSVRHQRLPSGRTAHVTSPTPTPGYVLARRAARQREIERLDDADRATRLQATDPLMTRVQAVRPSVPLPPRHRKGMAAVHHFSSPEQKTPAQSVAGGRLTHERSSRP